MLQTTRITGSIDFLCFECYNDNSNNYYLGEIMKYSKQRISVLEAVVSNSIHPTADQVYAMIKDDNPNVSLGTVYRNLNLLCETGQLRRICVANGCDRFDGRLDKHFHTICNFCGKVADVEIPEQLDLHSFVTAQTGYYINDIDIVMKGVCPECNKKSQTKKEYYHGPEEFKNL